MDKTISNFIEISPGENIITILPSFKEHSNNYYSSIKDKFQPTINRRRFVNFCHIILGIIFLAIYVYTSFYLPAELQPLTHIPYLVWMFVFLLLPIILGDKAQGILNTIEEKLMKNSLSEESIQFCRLQITIDKLQAYIHNNIQSDLDIATRQLKKYISEEDIYLKVGKEGNNSSNETVYEITHSLITSFSWFKVDKTTLQICSAFEDFEDKIISRLKAKKSIEEAIDILAYLKGYCYSNIPKQIQETIEIVGRSKEEMDIKEYGELLLISFAHQLKYTEKHSRPAEPKTLLAVLKKPFSFSGINWYCYLQHNNILICFLAWIVTLIPILGLIIYGFSKIMNVSINDPKIVAAFFTTLIAGAVAFTVKFCKIK